MGKPDETDREMIRRGDRIGADLARYLLRCHDERERMAQDWCDFCEMIGVEVDTHEAVAAQIKGMFDG